MDHEGTKSGKLRRGLLDAGKARRDHDSPRQVLVIRQYWGNTPTTITRVFENPVQVKRYIPDPLAGNYSWSGDQFPANRRFGYDPREFKSIWQLMREGDIG